MYSSIEARDKDWPKEPAALCSLRQVTLHDYPTDWYFQDEMFVSEQITGQN